MLILLTGGYRKVLRLGRHSCNRRISSLNDGQLTAKVITERETRRISKVVILRSFILDNKARTLDHKHFRRQDNSNSHVHLYRSNFDDRSEYVLWKVLSRSLIEIK